MSGSIFDPMTDPGWGGAPLYVSGNPQSTDPITFDTGNAGGWLDSPSSDGTSGISGTDLAKALKQLQGTTQPQTGGGASSQQRAQAGTAQSGTGQGSSAGINALISALMQRANAYFPGQPNRQPVALARPSGGGLLGI